MKKILSLFAVVAALFFASCSNNDEPEKPANSLEGTVWANSFSTSDDILVIEFTSSTDVIGYLADINGDPIYNPNSGSYKFDGKNVTFTDFTVLYFTFQNHFTSAEISGNFMTTKSWWEMGGEKYESTTTFRKR